MKLPLQQTDFLFIREIVSEFINISERFSNEKVTEDIAKDYIAQVLGYESYDVMEKEALEYIIPYQTTLTDFTILVKEKLFNFLPEEVDEEKTQEFIKTKFLPLKSVNTLIWKFEKHQTGEELIYRVAVSDIGKDAYILTSTFVLPDDIEESGEILNFTTDDVEDYLKAKKTLGYDKMHLTLSEGIDDMLAEIIAAIKFESSYVVLTDENFKFCKQSNNTILLTLPALVRICGQESDIYAYAFESNQDNIYFAVILNEAYLEDDEIYLGDIIEVSGEHIELLTNPTLYRDLLVYHNSIEPSYTPEELKSCFATYCDKDLLQIFDIWYDKYMKKLPEYNQNFFATKIMNHLTNLLLNKNLFLHKNLFLIEYNEEQYNKYKRNEISLNRESYKIRRLINNFMENFLKEKGVTVNFVPFDEKDYFEFIKKEKLVNNDDSKMLWLSKKYIGDNKDDKKLHDIGSFTFQENNKDI
jgi:hypothetical protein